MTTTGHASHWQEIAEQAMRESATLRKDAERYRWLRNVSAGCTNQAAPFICGAGDLPIHGDVCQEPKDKVLQDGDILNIRLSL